MLYEPTSELVVVAWLKGLDFIGSNVATQLPADNSSWSASGFLVVTPAGGSSSASAGGDSSMYLPIGGPVMSLDCWAVSPNSSKPPWNKAFQMAQRIRMYALETPELVARNVTLSATYYPAHVYSAWPLNEPRRIPSDPANYAHVSFDMEFRWRKTS